MKDPKLPMDYLRRSAKKLKAEDLRRAKRKKMLKSKMSDREIKSASKEQEIEEVTLPAIDVKAELKKQKKNRRR